MPGVLVELGYISTPDEERYLLTEAGTSALAKSIYQAFLSYKRQHNVPSGTRSVKSEAQEPISKPVQPTTPKESAKANEKKAPSASTDEGKPLFKIQILTSDKKLPANSKRFKGLSPVNFYQEKGIYKYTYGESHNYNKVLKTKRQITSKFKDAFIIAFKNGKKVNVNEAIKEFKNNR